MNFINHYQSKLKRENIKKTWYLIYLPAILSLTLIFTNDLHQLTFIFEYHNGEFSYRHGIVFYLALIWEILISIISLIVMIIKCQVSACRKKILIPIFTLLAFITPKLKLRPFFI